MFALDVSPHQMTPFHAAAKRGRCEKVLGLLIDKGGATCINIKDEDGVSAVCYSSYQVEICIVIVLSHLKCCHF